MIVYGINPVLEALKARRVTRLRVSARPGNNARRIDEILALAAKQGIAVERGEPQVLDRAARGGVHLGVIAEIAQAREYSVDDLARSSWEAGTEGGSHPGRQAPLLVVLDGVEDPHNVGAILRTCDAAGVTGVVRQERWALVEQVVGELAAAADADGARVDAAQVLGFLQQVPEGMRSSMQKDAAAGNPLELDAIGGAPLRVGAAAGVPMPALEELVSAVRAITGASGDSGADHPRR